MGLSGDFAKLSALRANLRLVGGAESLASIARVVGEAARTELALGFRNSVDPYGGAWERIRHRKGKPLLDTGRLRSSFTYRATADGLRIGTNVTYAPFHQYGTGGRKKAGGRSQAIDDRGRFLSHRKAGVKKGKNVVHLWHGFRRLNFAVGSGKITQRMMMPIASRGLGNWEAPMRAAATRAIARQLKGS